MEKQLKMDGELTSRFCFRVPVSTRLQADKIVAETGEKLSNILRDIVSAGLGQKAS